jgi:tetratricopeptide (TPR) repeat protein
MTFCGGQLQGAAVTIANIVNFATKFMKSLSILVLAAGICVSPLSLSLAAPAAVMAATPLEEAGRLNDRAIELYKAQDYNGAIQQLNRAIALDPTGAQLFLNRGYVKAKGLKDYSGAVADYDQAIRIKPDYAEAFARRAYSQEKLGKYQEALADYDVAIKASPQSGDWYFERGLLKHNRLKDLRGAILDYDKAVQLNPNDVVNYGFRGMAKRELGQREGAIADFRKGLALARSQNDADWISMMQESLRVMGVNE